LDKGINISSLSIGYSNKAILSNLKIVSAQNKMICLIGKNGQGKSTLLKTIAGLLPEINGSISFNNQSVLQLTDIERAKLLSIVLTEKIEIGNISVKDFIAFGRYPYTNWLGINNNDDHLEIDKAIELCEISELKNRNYTELSDGERQKVSIARAIAQNTPLIILDEPTAHLDLVNKVEILKLLKSLTENHGKTILISTHQIELAIQLCDEVWLLNNGIIEVNSPKTIINNGTLNKLFDNESVTFNAQTKSFNLK